jgi:hypothetical protein
MRPGQGLSTVLNEADGPKLPESVISVTIPPMLRPVLLLCSACLLALAAGAADAAKPQPAVFRAALTATLTKNWTFTRVETVAGCTRTTRAVGRWQARLATRTPTRRVVAIPVTGGRVRFSGATLRAIAGAATQAGTMAITTEGPRPCDRFARTVRCGEQRRRFSGASVSFGSPRRGVLRFRRLRGVGRIRSFDTVCPEETNDIRAIRTDLPLAPGPLDRADVFAPGVRRWFVSGDSEQVTTIEGEVPGRVTERVRWTLTFTRTR